MSFTSTVSTANHGSASGNRVTRTSSILLSPSKRKRVEEPESDSKPLQTAKSVSPKGVNSSRPGGCANNQADKGATTNKPQKSGEIWKWTLTRDAVASCFAKDVLEMRESGTKGAEFFWLGRIPCRSVRLVGLLVGVQVYDQRTIYSLDDGSAVIDCIRRHPAQAVTNNSPSKPKSKTLATSTSPFKSTLRSPTKRPTTKRTSGELVPVSPSLPKPVAHVGTSVLVVGRVMTRGEGRILMIDTIEPCSSPNDEPKHWLTVVELHKTSYFASDLGPFIVPPLSTRPPTAITDSVGTRTLSPNKVKDKGKLLDGGSGPAVIAREDAQAWEPQTPSSGLSSTDGSPSSVASTSSQGRQTSPRLRHPSRLHSRDLTANTFRIYLKHYMDHAPQHNPRSTSASSSRSVSPSPFPRNSQPSAAQEALDELHMLKTPTKRSGAKREIANTVNEETPRPSQLRTGLERLQREIDRTPLASRATDPSWGKFPSYDSDHDDAESSSGVYGFTLSHLRRVPELATLARRVVDAEARRRAREERKQADGGTAQSKQKISQRPQAAGREPKNAKIKRLFRHAIRQLYEEGSIVLWDGPVRPLQALSYAQGFDALWKANASSNSTVSTVGSISQLEEDEEVLSDPQPGEEAYIPLTPAYFATIVEGAITDIMVRAAAKASASKHRTRPRTDFFPDSALLRPAPPPGPTPDEILAWLRRDARWERVGDWTVKETLEWAKGQGRVWCVGNERWEVCG